MYKKLTFLFFTFLFYAGFCQAQSALRAMRQLEKGNLERALNIVERAASKDPTDPANSFVLAQYYIHPQKKEKKIDSAHVYIQLAAAGFKLLEEDNRKRYIRKGMDSLRVAQLGLEIDSLAYEAATEVDTEEAYAYFIVEYPEAAQYEEAVFLRNERAYQNALAENTPEAMQSFFRKYPGAEQAKEARDAFETLYYEQQTKDKTAQAFRLYLQENPGSAHAEQAALNLLQIISTAADREVYEGFRDQYPGTEAAKLAARLLTYLPDTAVNHEMIAHYKNDSYRFFDVEEKRLLDLRLPEVVIDSCMWIKGALIEAEGENAHEKYLKNGEILLKEPADAVFYLASGFFKIFYPHNFKWQLLHSSKDDDLAAEAMDFKKVDEYFLARKEYDGWQLVSLLGEQVLNQPVDSIWKERDIYFFKREDKMALAKSHELTKEAKTDFKNLAFLYTDYEMLDGGYIWMASDKFEMVLDEDLNTVIPLQKASIRKMGSSWSLFKDAKYEVLNSVFAPLYSTQYDKVKSVSDILALKVDSRWAVTKESAESFPDFQYDSVRLFNNWLSFASYENRRELIFHQGKNVQLAEEEYFTILKSYNEGLAEQGGQMQYVEIVNQKAYHKLYNGFGKLIYEGQQLKSVPVSNDLLHIADAKQKVLVDSSGVRLLSDSRISAIGKLKDGLVPVLKNQKFGAFLISSKEMLPYKSENKIQVFKKDSLFIFTQNGLVGLMDKKGKEILEPKYVSIEYLNDSMAFVKESGVLELRHIYSEDPVLKNISDKDKVMVAGVPNYIIRIDSGYGVINQKGENVIPFIFNSLEAVSDHRNFIWIAERSIVELDYQIIAYYDQSGDLLFREGLTNSEYLKSICE